jgi:signal transduction histidine kinase
VSHDLRTPLSAIYGQAHLIRRTAGAPDKIEARAAAIERSCERMSGMIQDLVEVTLLEAGQLPLACARVDLAVLLPDIVDGMRGGLDVERVRLEVQSPCWASLDPARLERIVVNLVSNALKYSSSDVQVILEGGADSVVLTVVDRGVGIAPEDQARIFERYFRARADRQPEGLGLGLYITRLLVEAQGGTIEVESRLGQGSTFRVRFADAGP